MGNEIIINFKDGKKEVIDYSLESLCEWVHKMNNFIAFGYNSTNYPDEVIIR